MKHFQIEDWADLARGVASASAAQAMQEHLETPCRSCEATLNWCKTMTQVGSRETGFEPSEAAVRSAKALAALVRPRKSSLARLVFDTFRQPALAGVRAAGAPPRQFVFESGDIVVDIKVDPINGSDKIHILGQVMRKEGPSISPYVPITLRKGKQQSATTFANRFGEFQFETKSTGELNLVFVLADSRIIEVPLGTAETPQRP